MTAPELTSTASSSTPMEPPCTNKMSSTTPTLPSIAPEIRSVLSLLGGWASLTATEQAELVPLVEEFPHDVAEAKASSKQIAFRDAFMARQDAKGRPCGIFVALGGNRAGKSFVCAYLC